MGWGMILKARMILQPKPDDSETKTDDSATKSDSATKKPEGTQLPGRYYPTPPHPTPPPRIC